MAKSTSDLCMIARAGAGVKIDASRFSTSDLCMIARAGVDSGAMLFIINADTKSTSDLCMIGRANPGRVVLE